MTANADYLRPFAPESTGSAALPDDPAGEYLAVPPSQAAESARQPWGWTTPSPAGQPWAWTAPSPSGQAPGPAHNAAAPYGGAGYPIDEQPAVYPDADGPPPQLYQPSREAPPDDYASGGASQLDVYPPARDYGPDAYAPAPEYLAGGHAAEQPVVGYDPGSERYSGGAAPGPAQWTRPAADKPPDVLAGPPTGAGRTQSERAHPGLAGPDPHRLPAQPWSVQDEVPAPALPLDDAAAGSRPDVRRRHNPSQRPSSGRRAMRGPALRSPVTPDPAGQGAPLPGSAPRNGRWVSVAAAAVVLIITAAAAVILLSGGHKSANAGRPGRRAAASHSSHPAAPPSASPARLVTVQPAAQSGPDAPAVVSFVTRYFKAINRHDFGAYRRLFSTSLRGGLSAAAFASGYGTSRDSLATLHSITAAGSGELDAVVTFTSHQQPADSPTHTTCTAWNISLYLIRQGHGYVIVSPPAGYQASFSSCS